MTDQTITIARSKPTGNTVVVCLTLAACWISTLVYMNTSNRLDASVAQSQDPNVDLVKRAERAEGFAAGVVGTRHD